MWRKATGKIVFSRRLEWAFDSQKLVAASPKKNTYEKPRFTKKYVLKIRTFYLELTVFYLEAYFLLRHYSFYLEVYFLLSDYSFYLEVFLPN